jgi:hypothetical protein
MNISFDVVPKPDGDILYSAQIEWCGLEVINITIYYKIVFKYGENSQPVTFRDTSIDVCKTIRGLNADFFLKTIVAELKKNIDFELKCPFKKVCRKILAFLFLTSIVFHSAFTR